MLNSGRLVSSKAHCQVKKLPSALQLSAARVNKFHYNNYHTQKTTKYGLQQPTARISSLPSINAFTLINKESSTTIQSSSTTLTEIQSRYFFKYIKSHTKHFFSKERKEANKNPTDAEAQLKYFKQLNELGLYKDLKARWESGTYAISDDARKEYMLALVKLGEFDKVNFKEFLSETGRIVGSGAEGGSGGGNGGSTGGYSAFGGRAQVIPVQITNPGVSSGGMDRFFKFLAFVAVGLVLYALLSGSGSEGMASSLPFNIPDAHTQVTNVDVKLDDVKGVDEAKDELKEVVEYLKDPKKFAKLGARLPKGILLVGEPGTGKTMLARAIAGEAGVPYLYCSGSAFDEMFVGVGPKRIRSLFEDAKKLAPCIVFIDEIDAIGISRKKSMNSGYTKENTLNQLLTELDGFKPTKGIIIIGATNLPEALDPALVRPGRFDKQIVVPVPDLKGRKEIIDLYLKKTVPGPNVDSGVIARGTPGFTGADLSNLINIAAIKATMKDKSFVDMKDLEEAKDDVIMGIKRKGREEPESRKMTAYHEGGHALVALYTEGSVPLHKATIIQRGSALGMTVQLPETDVTSTSRKQMLARLACMMGGRAAEEVIYGADEVSSGASSDFKQATRLAYNMVTRFGMSNKVGMVATDELEHMSDEQKRLVDTEVKEILQNAYNNAKGLLTTRKSELDRVAQALLEFETLSGDEIKQVAQGKTLDKRIFS